MRRRLHGTLLLALLSTAAILSQSDTVCITGVGDIMLGTDYPSPSYLPPGRDCHPLLEDVRDLLAASDVTFGNLEGVMAGDRGKPKYCRDSTRCFVFRMPEEYAACLKDAGFDLLSTANNHVRDFGREGSEHEAGVLERAGIAFAGLSTHPYAIIERDSVRYGLCAFAPNAGTVSMLDTAGAVRLIRKVSDLCDILIVSVHGGGEGEEYQHVTRERELYLGNDRGNIYAFAHALIDAGADVVFGHGPHVTRAVELYRGRFIAYSLGNFCTYGRFNLSGPRGFAPLLRVFTDREGRFLSGKIIPVRQTGRGGTHPDPGAAVIGIMQRLSEEDFPEDPLTITDEGIIIEKGKETAWGGPVRETEKTMPGMAPVADSGSTVIRIINGTFLGNAQRNYYGNRAPSALHIVWKTYLGKGKTVISRRSGSRIWAGAGWTGQPLLVSEDGTLYLIQGAYDHHLKKFRAADGKLVWEYEFDDVIKGTGTIWHNQRAVNKADEYVIMQGSRLGVGHYLDARHVPSFRAISYMSGRELWRMDVKWTDSYSRDVDASALVIRDTAYIGLENSLFTVFDPDPAAATFRDSMLQPKIYQQTRLYKKEDVTAHRYNVVTEASPSRMGHMIYLASGSGHVWGYDLEKKALTWDFVTGSDMDGSTIVTSDDCVLASIEKQYIEGPGGAIKLDPSKEPEHAVVWYFPTEDKEYASWKGGIIGSIAVNDNYRKDGPFLAAFTAIDGNLYVVEHDRIDTSRTVAGPDNKPGYALPSLVFSDHVGPSISTPLFTGDRLIVAGYGGIRLYAYDRESNFRLLDEFRASFESTPVCHDGRIYVASRNGYLYCFGD